MSTKLLGTSGRSGDLSTALSEGIGTRVNLPSCCHSCVRKVKHWRQSENVIKQCMNRNAMGSVAAFEDAVDANITAVASSRVFQ